MGWIAECKNCKKRFLAGEGMAGQKGDLPAEANKCPECGGGLDCIGFWD